MSRGTCDHDLKNCDHFYGFSAGAKAVMRKRGIGPRDLAEKSAI
jgi:hypothetical protein